MLRTRDGQELRLVDSNPVNRKLKEKDQTSRRGWINVRKKAANAANGKAENNKQTRYAELRTTSGSAIRISDSPGKFININTSGNHKVRLDDDKGTITVHSNSNGKIFFGNEGGGR